MHPTYPVQEMCAIAEKTCHRGWSQKRMSSSLVGQAPCRCKYRSYSQILLPVRIRTRKSHHLFRTPPNTLSQSDSGWLSCFDNGPPAANEIRAGNKIWKVKQSRNI
mmetsp:Transcript_88276/g.156290  ORF Transcript_88276/g.156290 Transcript_88276/m.156290 type:complete len:106 (-) Transcript_88276:501-818(-)